jgi:hypothetical protein
MAIVQPFAVPTRTCNFCIPVMLAHLTLAVAAIYSNMDNYAGADGFTYSRLPFWYSPWTPLLFIGTDKPILLH